MQTAPIAAVSAASAVEQSVEGREASTVKDATKLEARQDARTATSAPPEGQRRSARAAAAAAAAAASVLDSEANDADDEGVAELPKMTRLSLTHDVKMDLSFPTPSLSCLLPILHLI